MKKPIPKLIVGIDPGLSGAVAFLDVESMQLLKLIDMPTYKRNKAKRRRVDAMKLANLIDNYFGELNRDYDQAYAFLEDVHPRPGQGLVSTGQLLRAAGVCEGVLAGLLIEYDLVHPNQWKPRMVVTQGKTISRFKAMNLWPPMRELFKRKADSDRAEAALIAAYGFEHVLRLGRFRTR